jgi:hypothetical protein
MAIINTKNGIDANLISIKGPLAFCGIYFYPLLLDVPFLIRIIISLPFILHATTFCLAVASFKSCFILLGIAIISGDYVAYSYLPKTKMRYKELTHEELV